MAENTNDHLTTIYQQAFEQHRYYITWRERLTAGFLAVLTGLVIALGWLSDKGLPEYYYIVFLAGMFVSYGFYQMDLRNLSLTHACQNVAATIEEKWGLNFDKTTNRNEGLASTLDNSGSLLNTIGSKKDKSKKEKIFNHSDVLKFTFFAVMIICFIGLTGSIYAYNSEWLNDECKNKIFQWVNYGSGLLPIIMLFLLLFFLFFYKNFSSLEKKEKTKTEKFRQLYAEYKLLQKQNETDGIANKINKIEAEVIELIKSS